MFQGGHYEHLDDPDLEQIKMQIGRYYNYFAKSSDDNDVVFTVPYNDSGGLGNSTAPCTLIIIIIIIIICTVYCN